MQTAASQLTGSDSLVPDIYRTIDLACVAGWALSLLEREPSSTQDDALYRDIGRRSAVRSFHVGMMHEERLRISNLGSTSLRYAIAICIDQHQRMSI